MQVARKSRRLHAPPPSLKGREETTRASLCIDLRRAGARGREGGAPDPLGGARVPERRTGRQRAVAAEMRALCARKTSRPRSGGFQE